MVEVKYNEISCNGGSNQLIRSPRGNEFMFNCMLDHIRIKK